MTRPATRTYFGRIDDGRIELRTSKGCPTLPPITSGAQLVICRNDCNVICLETRRMPMHRVRRFVERELPRVFPGSLAGHLFDIVVQSAGKKLALLLVIMREERLALYEAAVGDADLVLASQLVAVSRLSSRLRGSAPERVVIRQGAARELVSLRRAAVVASYLLPPVSGLPTDVVEVIEVARPGENTMSAAGSAFPASSVSRSYRSPPHSLFDWHRGVRPWMRSCIVSPLLVALTLAAFAAGDLAMASLLATRRSAVKQMQDCVIRSSNATRISAEAARRTQEIASQLDRLVEMRPRDVYLLLSELWRTLAGVATVRQITLLHGTAEIQLLSRDPVEVLQVIADSPSITSVELVDRGRELPDGRFAITARVVFK